MPQKKGFRRFASLSYGSSGSGRQKQEAGLVPVTIEHWGEQRMDKTNIRICDYDKNHITERDIESIEDAEPFLAESTNTWLNIQGLHDIEKLKTIWNYFKLHPLIQEDIADTTQRPKIEHYDDYSFFVVRMLHYAADTEELHSEQVSIVLGENIVLSFQESDKPIFEPIFKRLKLRLGRIRQSGADYLTYALIDTVVDHYFNLLAILGERIEDTEDQILIDPQAIDFQYNHELRKKLTYTRKIIWPLRDMLNRTIHDESAFVEDTTKIYLRDVHDHVSQIIDNLESYRDMIRGTQDIYSKYIDNKMNEVMTVLTIIATIFIPLTFITGIYGMNFDNMPGLHWKWGYPVSILVMLIVAVGMLSYFKAKDWL